MDGCPQPRLGVPMVLAVDLDVREVGRSAHHDPLPALRTVDLDEGLDVERGDVADGELRVLAEALPDRVVGLVGRGCPLGVLDGAGEGDRRRVVDDALRLPARAAEGQAGEAGQER
jgi:hypothetical protein